MMDELVHSLSHSGQNSLSLDNCRGKEYNIKHPNSSPLDLKQRKPQS